MRTTSTDRQIRVFISSTFTDMKADRDYLVKFIFPQLRKLCEERAVTWTEVDLRWGVTDEQKAEGKVLPIVMAEVERCHPYFIGLLGERYGQVYRDQIPADLAEQFPWLKEHADKSLTELEILHGVLNNKELADHALFYFRDQAYAEEKSRAGQADFISKDEASRKKLGDLKQRIRDAYKNHKLKSAPRETPPYANPQALGEQLLADFTGIIEGLYPKAETPDPLDQEAARHDAYARSRRLAFVGRKDLLRRLDEHISTEGKPLVLTGESGCGKSALIAEWVNRWREKHPDDLIIQHYMGSTPASADWQGLVRRILGELKRAFAVPENIPFQPDLLLTALNAWMAKVAGGRRIVLVLDALNQLADNITARDLGWLPIIFPANLRVLVSAHSTDKFDALRHRGWPELNVPLFAPVDIAPAALAYFKIFSKTPPADLTAKLESTLAATNALYLRAVLDELRQFGEHDELKVKASNYLSATNPKELYERILTRWKQDFGEDLVHQSLSLIWAARRGLSEAELLDLLGSDGQPLPRAKWTPFYLATEYSLAQRNGTLAFGHDFLREAVQQRFLLAEADRRATHLRLANYFDSPNRDSTRVYEELPWQLVKAEEWERAIRALRNFFTPDEQRWELVPFWQEVEERSSLSVEDAYKHVFERPDDGDFLEASFVLVDLGKNEAAIRLHESYLLKKGNTSGFVLDQYVVLLFRVGRYQDALGALEKLEAIYKKSGSQPGLERCLGLRAIILAQLKDFEIAMPLLIKQAQDCRTEIAREKRFPTLADVFGNHSSHVLAECLVNQSHILIHWGQPDKAIVLLEEAEDIARKIGDVESLSGALGNHGVALRLQERFKDALSKHEEQERVCRETGNSEALAQCIIQQGLVHEELREYDAALHCFISQEGILRALKTWPRLEECLGHKARVLEKLGRHAEAAECRHQQDEARSKIQR